MRWVITGHRGQLGHALCEQLAGEEVAAAVDLPEVDVSDPQAVKALFEGLPGPPDVVVNAAALTHVDRCEREPELAHRANAVAPGLLAEAARAAGARFVHVSTDYVFPGDAARPYREDDPTGPRSAYGRTKLEGEERVRAADPDALVVRTSWVFGRGRNFIAAILHQADERRKAGSREPLRVVDDQRGRPTWSVDLATSIRQLVLSGASGLYHVSNRGECSWWELARAILEEAGSDLPVEKIRTCELSLDAPRPAWSVLDLSKAESAGIAPRHWREALRAYLASADSPTKSEAR